MLASHVRQFMEPASATGDQHVSIGSGGRFCERCPSGGDRHRNGRPNPEPITATETRQSSRQPKLITETEPDHRARHRSASITAHWLALPYRQAKPHWNRSARLTRRRFRCLRRFVLRCQCLLASARGKERGDLVHDGFDVREIGDHASERRVVSGGCIPTLRRRL